MSVVARRRTLAGIAALVVLAVVGVLLTGGSSPSRRAAAAQLVPADALVYVHVSTRDKRGRELAARFPSIGRLRDSVLRRLSVSGQGGDIDSWLGDEAALALVDTRGTTAGSLVVVQVRDEAKARDFVAAGRGSAKPTDTYKGVKLSRYGSVMAGFVDGYLVLGQEQTLHEAIDLAQGRGHPLADDDAYRRAVKGLPGGRVADAYATGDGVRRLLAPAGGVLGIAGLLLNRPGLQSAAVALTVQEPGARLYAHSVGPAAKPFRPALLAKVPGGVLAYLGLRGFDSRLLALAGASPAFARRLAAHRDALRGEVAVVLSAAADRTVLTLYGKDGLVLSTGRAPRGDGTLARSAAFRRVVADPGGRVTAVGFLDFDQLLKLAERTGLNDSRAYQAVRADLTQVRAVGFSSSGSGGDTTAEIRFDIP